MGKNKGKQKNKKDFLKEILTRDDYRCGIHYGGCKRTLNPEEVTIDHIFPKQLFEGYNIKGEYKKYFNSPINLQPMCSFCNEKKGGLPPFPYFFPCNCHESKFTYEESMDEKFIDEELKKFKKLIDEQLIKKIINEQFIDDLKGIIKYHYSMKENDIWIRLHTPPFKLILTEYPSGIGQKSFILPGKNKEGEAEVSILPKQSRGMIFSYDKVYRSLLYGADLSNDNSSAFIYAKKLHDYYVQLNSTFKEEII